MANGCADSRTPLWHLVQNLILIQNNNLMVWLIVNGSGSTVALNSSPVPKL